MKKTVFAIILVAVVAGGAWLFLGKGDSSTRISDLPVASVQTGDMVIDVLEGGNIQALNYLEFRNEVKSSAGVKILEIIDEGYMVTEEDVKNGKILVRLDPSQLEEEIVDHDVQFQQTEAAYAEAKQNIEIEESEALSDIKAARQVLRFSLLDFQKFVGAEAADQVLKKLKLPFDTESLEIYEEKATALIVKAFDSKKLAESARSDEEMNPYDLEAESSLASNVNFGNFLKNELLGDGEAEQTIRRMKDEALVAASELSVKEESLEGAKRLFQKDFITRQTLDNEQVSLEKAELALQRSKTELELFRDYEFPKEAEKMLSKYEEALLSLIRTKREEMAKMSQIYARYRSAKRRYDLELKKRANLEEQVASCIIKAELPGLVAYGGAQENYYTSRYYDGISEGATLKTGQPIITIPDMSQLGVEVNIHESHIKKIELGQKVYITAESVPDKTLEGKIAKVAVLPDSNASRYNPSLKVYPATVEIDGTHEFLKPGMSAKVEIIVSELQDVNYVPVQSVFVEEDEHFVFRSDGNNYERHPVKVGAHNNDFIEVVEGLDEGEEVLLKMPDDYEPPQMEIARGPKEREVEKGSGVEAVAKKAVKKEAKLDKNA
ncbi:MAG: efflux RND transporter periplasmic adaptor subunit [Verrucomicrobiales bacterium]|nr:efflux RND transporter periplasmic adaptor subunit [Verrucomicrobiales bacterium]